MKTAFWLSINAPWFHLMRMYRNDFPFTLNQRQMDSNVISAEHIQNVRREDLITHTSLFLLSLAFQWHTATGRKKNKKTSFHGTLITCSWQPPKKWRLGVCGLSLSHAWCLTNYNLLQYNNIQLIKDQCDISCNLSGERINHILVEVYT